MPFRLIADANAQTTIALALTSGATSFVGGSTAAFTSPQSFGVGQGSLTLLDSGNPAWNPAAPLATPYEYAYYTTNTTGTNTISGLTRGVAGTTAKSFFAGATVAQGLLAEDLVASVPWKFDEASPTTGTVTIPSAGTIPASYLGITWRDILIRVWGRGDAAAVSTTVRMQLNADVTAAHYTWSALATTGATPAGTLPTSDTSITVGVIPAATATATLPGHVGIEIPEYANTAFVRTAMSRMGFNGGGTAFEIASFNGNWVSTAALTSITVFLSAGNFVAGSRITTYLIP